VRITLRGELPLLHRYSNILMLLPLLFLTFSKWFVIIEFKINQQYIATHLCINRDKPWLHCNGKCFLKKKMQQQEQQDKTTGNSVKDKSDIFYYRNYNHFRVFVPSHIIPFNNFYQGKTYPSPTFPFFHPPKNPSGC
jgi:hypothetical protein